MTRSAHKAISEPPPTAAPLRPHLMARNRLQSGLACAVIVIESGESGGAMRTAEIAQRQDRLVYAVRWPQMTGMRRGPGLGIVLPERTSQA